MYLLIADDNAVTLQFLGEAAAQLGQSWRGAVDGTAALELARAQRFDLLLLDLHMPGLDGVAVLRELRASAQAASQTARAIITTADLSAGQHESLLAAGFAAVLRKPLDLATLQQALGGSGVAEDAADYAAADETIAPLLDDALALRSLGSEDGVRALRRLFRLELDALPAEIDAVLGRNDPTALRGRLHRLCASAGFCGAPRLDQACRALRSQIEGAAELTPQHLLGLREIVAATRAALEAAPASSA